MEKNFDFSFPNWINWIIKMWQRRAAVKSTQRGFQHNVRKIFVYLQGKINADVAVL